MNFFKRLQYYLFGVGLGIILVYYYIRNRDFDAWLPEGRVLEHLMRSSIEADPVADCQLKCLGLEMKAIKDMLTDAEVEFDKSEPRRDPCPIYHIEGKNAEHLVIMKVESCRDSARLVTISEQGKECPCN